MYKSHKYDKTNYWQESEHTLFKPAFVKGFSISCVFIIELQIKQV